MARIISFAQTTPALLAGEKCVTRRYWKDSFAAQWKAGEEAIAYDKGPRNGGKPVARIRLTAAPEKQRANQVMPSDWRKEGFAYMEEHGLTLFGGKTPAEVYNGWASAPDEETLWLVQFEVIETSS